MRKGIKKQVDIQPQKILQDYEAYDDVSYVSMKMSTT